MNSPLVYPTVVEHHRLRDDLAVVRLVGDFAGHRAGQHLQVRVPQRPDAARRLSPALPPSRDGKLEFHVKAVPGGWVSPTIVNDTRPGDVWEVGAAAGDLHIDDSGRPVLMVAGGTGLAPLRALLLDLTRWAEPPRTFLFFGGHTPRDLYAADMLYLLDEQLDWLTALPVAEWVAEPNIRDENYERVRSVTSFDHGEYIEGTLAAAVTAHGNFSEYQILLSGSHSMLTATRSQLIANGTPAGNIRHDAV